MLLTQTSNTENKEGIAVSADEDLHARAQHYISEANQIIFRDLPQVISEIIAHEVWQKREISYKNFGEYALSKAPDGLGIANNDMLWLLKSAMNINMQHTAYWGDVLDEVDTSVRTYAKENKISIKELNGSLNEFNPTNPQLLQEEMITYLPSRSNSSDRHLLKLKMKDPQAYDEVTRGIIKLKEAMPQTPRKKLQPVETVKNKFSSLSKSEREEFLAWVEQQKENLS